MEENIILLLGVIEFMSLQWVVSHGVSKYLPVVVEANSCYRLFHCFQSLQFCTQVLVPEQKSTIRSHCQCQVAQLQLPHDCFLGQGSAVLRSVPAAATLAINLPECVNSTDVDYTVVEVTTAMVFYYFMRSCSVRFLAVLGSYIKVLEAE